MKNIVNSLTVIFFCVSVSLSVKAQTTPSAMAVYYPSTSNLIGNATRIGYHINDLSTFYMRYNDASYFCSTLCDAIWVLSPTIFKIAMPQDFIITDFKKFSALQGFIGSYEGVGMYGWANTYEVLNGYNTIFAFKMPTVDKLKRIALARTGQVNLKAFAIGDKLIASKGPRQSHIMEFRAMGDGVFSPYLYAPMAYDKISNENETADDVINLDRYVVFVTRDSRAGHAPLNLRIADTTNALSGSDINYQWQFLLSVKEKLLSEARMVPLNNKDFALVYTKYDSIYQKNYLCYHKINISDFVTFNNTIVSYEVEIGSGCTQLVDAVYEPDVKTLVMLLNGNNRSELYHADPTVNMSASVTKLEYTNGKFYSIDTIGSYYHYNSDMYFAMGNDVLFGQDISNGIEINESCLVKSKVKSLLKDPPQYTKINDPINIFSEEKNIVVFHKQVDFFEGRRTCMTPDIPELKTNR